jgi:hypothetical protein
MKIKINKLQNQLIQRFRSKDKCRYVLNHIGVIDGAIYSTDGRRCVKIQMKSPIPDGTYRFFFDGDHYYLFKEEELFPDAKKIMPDFGSLKEVCKVRPRRSDGLSMMNCILDIFQKTSRRINLDFIIDLDVGCEYSVFVKDGEETKDGGYLYLLCDHEDALFGKPEIVLLPFNK